MNNVKKPDGLLIIHGLSNCHCIVCSCFTARECYFDCVCEYCPHYNSTEDKK